MLESYIYNLLTRQWLKSIDEPTPVNAPEWGQGDIRLIGVTYVIPLGVGTVQRVQNLVSARLGIGTPGSTPATTATAGTPDDFEYPFVVDLAQAAITTLLVTDSISTTLEFRLEDTTGPKRYRAPLRIVKQLISDVVSDPIPPQVALTRDDANGIYTPKEVPKGMRQIWIDEVTDIPHEVYLANGQWQCNPLG